MMTVEYRVSVLVSHHSRVACSSPCGALSLAGAFLRRFFTAAGGVCHSLVPRPWYRWFILYKLLSQPLKRFPCNRR
jgi:hypothetical protein